MIKLVIISDTHGAHREIDIPDGDVLIHAGDFTGLGMLEEVAAFNAFLGTLPHRHKIIIAGNHDFCFQRAPAEARRLLTHGIYLQDEAVLIDGVKYYGSPWQPWFFNWAFNLPRGAQLREKWALIDPDTDVLITHGPPMGYGDIIPTGQSVGCADLLDVIEAIAPTLHICGHIHEGYGVRNNEQTVFINASICNLDYEAVNPAVIFPYNPVVK